MSFAKINDHNVSFDPKAIAAERRNPTPPKVNRRTILRGTAAAVALPALESLLRPSRAEAQAAPPIRWVSWHIGCGVWHPSWDVTTFGTGYTLSPSLMPLAPIKDKVLVLMNVDNTPTCNQMGSHGCGPPAMTTCRQGTKPGISMGISVDQVYAQSLGTATRIQSLQLSVTDRTFADTGYPAVYNGTTAWANATTPLPPTVNPQQVFDRLFAGMAATPPAGDTAAAAALAKRTALRTSVLDFVQTEAKTLQPRLGKTDRGKLDQYLTSIRAVETEVQKVSATPNSCTPGATTRPTLTKYAAADVPAMTTIMLDLMVLAFQCDATRVINFHQGHGGNMSFASCPWLNISSDHHGISHHNNDATKGAQLAKIDLWEVQQYVYFLQKLDAVKEGARTALDNSLIFLSSEIADGNNHGQVNKPVLIAGSAGGKILTGRATNVNKGLQANMFITLLNQLGVPAKTFGLLGDKPLEGLTA
ncbi:MAG: DUF1552 domain-containing protein [Verrucomicrobiota bacterium]